MGLGVKWRGGRGKKGGLLLDNKLSGNLLEMMELFTRHVRGFIPVHLLIVLLLK